MNFVALIRVVFEVGFLFFSAEALAGETYEELIRVEKLIQSSGELTDARERLNALDWLAEAIGIPKATYGEEAWKSKRDKCHDVSCLSGAYKSRFSDVNALFDSRLEVIDGPVSWQRETEHAVTGRNVPCNSLFFGNWRADGMTITGSMEHTGQCGDKVDDRDFEGRIFGKVAFVDIGGEDPLKPGLALLAHVGKKVYFKLIKIPESESSGFYFPDDEIAEERVASH